MTSPFGLSYFRYRRRHARILEIYEIFLDSPKRLLHPIEISRECGLHMLDVIDTLDRAPEIFLRVPSGRETTTKYGLRPAVAVQEHEEIEEFIRKRVFHETLYFYGILIVVILTVVVLGLSLLPYLVTLF